jgi:hypothetical protein
MAQPGGTVDRYDLNAAGDMVREDFTDVVYNISPTEVPFQTNIGRGKAYSDLHEWPIDALAAANASNAQIDGDDFSGDTRLTGNRLSNYCQISWIDIVVSRRANIVRKAGRRAELAYQVAKAAKELRRDVESVLLSNQAARAGNATLAPLTAGLPAWIGAFDDTTNYEIATGYVNRGALGADGGLSGTSDASGYVDTAASEGTHRALTEDGLLDVIRSCYINGAEPTMIMVGPTVKQLFSKYMFSASARIATPYQDHGKGRSGAQVLGAVDFYVSDFGTLSVVPNRFQRVHSSDYCDVFVLDPEFLEISYLDGYKQETIAKSGDSEKRRILVDYALTVKNPVAHGIYADVDDDTAMVAS